MFDDRDGLVEGTQGDTGRKIKGKTERKGANGVKRERK